MNKDFLNIKQAANSGKLTPAKHVWDRVDSRLKLDIQESKIKTLSFQKMILGIASCVLLAVLVYTYNANLSNQYSAGELAKLAEAQSDIYAVNNVRKVNALYK